MTTYMPKVDFGFNSKRMWHSNCQQEASDSFAGPEMRVVARVTSNRGKSCRNFLIKCVACGAGTDVEIPVRLVG